MSRSPILLGFALTALTACTQVRYSGRSNTATATAGVQDGRIFVRPNELSWRIGDSVNLSTSVIAKELGGFQSGGVVLVEVDAAGVTQLPDYVEYAATTELIRREADGFLVTHYIVEAEGSGDNITYNVQIWGRLLILDDLGPMSEERADLRRLIKTLERQRGFSSGTSAPSPFPSSFANTRQTRSAKERPIRFGFELGSVTGLKLDFAIPSRAIDAIALRIGGEAGLMFGYDSPHLGPAVAIQVEFLDASLVQPVVGAAVNIAATNGGYVGASGLLGVEIDSKGPFEANVGARVGSAGGATTLVPDLSIGWIW